MKRKTWRLSRIKIRGYKSIPFTYPLVLDIGDINILLGANGSGKSNIISFFKMLGYMMTGRLQEWIARTGTNDSILYYGPKVTPTMSASLRFDDPEKTYDIYSFSLTAAAGNRVVITSEEIEWQRYSDEKRPVSIPLRGDFHESALVRNIRRIEQTVGYMVGACKVYQFSDSSATAPMRRPSTVESAHYLQSEANNLASFLYYLRKNYRASYERITSYVRDVVPQFREFYLEPEGRYISLKWEDTSINDYILTADQFSDGSIRFIALATLLLQPPETMPFVIIIDEPELGLHPYAIDQLNEMIRDASRHAQIIIATQSPGIIDGFDPDDVTVIERDVEIEGTVANHLSAEELQEWLNEYSMSELWGKNVFGGRPR
ncbi:MAG: AAA family ATPase [Muribaculaceae bacterium]|nr:AAA family ATPase [Muribaculaceae bacterium]